MAEENEKYSPDNWAHQALLLMDEADLLIRWGAVSHPDPERYKAAAKAFWDACHMLAQERTRLHNAEIVRLDAAGGQSERMEG